MFYLTMITYIHSLCSTPLNLLCISLLLQGTRQQRFLEREPLNFIQEALGLAHITPIFMFLKIIIVYNVKNTRSGDPKCCVGSPFKLGAQVELVTSLGPCIMITSRQYSVLPCTFYIGSERGNGLSILLSLSPSVFKTPGLSF